MFSEEGSCLTLQLKNGQKVMIYTKPRKCTSLQRHDTPEDGVKNYGHMVLELGLLFKNLLDMIKYPDRDRALRLFKLSMTVFKVQNNLSKYALELLRLLVHQQCILSLQGAHEEFYGLFVNTSGKLDGHIPADERMEWMVNVVKKHIKHMGSDQTEKNLESRTSALAGVQDVASQYDNVTNVIVRQRSHSCVSPQGDEMTMVNDLRRLRPFRFTAGRHHKSFPKMKSSILEGLDVENFKNWLNTCHFRFATEHGN